MAGVELWTREVLGASTVASTFGTWATGWVPLFHFFRRGCASMTGGGSGFDFFEGAFWGAFWGADLGLTNSVSKPALEGLLEEPALGIANSKCVSPQADATSSWVSNSKTCDSLRSTSKSRPGDSTMSTCSFLISKPDARSSPLSTPFIEAMSSSEMTITLTLDSSQLSSPFSCIMRRCITFRGT